MSTQESPRQRLLSTATRLFCRDGILTTGVDRIVSESGAARGSLYRTFGSKSGLVAAALDREGDAWRQWLFDELDKIDRPPQEKLLALFDLLADWFRRDDYFGCLFMNATIETRNADPSVRQALKRHKDLVMQRVRELVTAAEARDPDQLVDQLDLLVDGAIVKAFISRDEHPARQAREAARLLLASACPPAVS